MIALPKEIREIYDLDVIQYNMEIENLRLQSISSKKKLLSEQFFQLPKDCTKDDKVKFVLQFKELISVLILFPDEEVIMKFKSLKFSNLILKWFIPLDKILLELERLTNIDGFFFLKYQYFFAVQAHLQTKALIALIEGFGLNTNYNNSDTNIFFKDFAKRYERRYYNQKKMQTPKMDDFEKKMNYMFDRIEHLTNDQDLAKQNVLQPIKGNTSAYYFLLGDFIYDGKSKNKAYKELFPLLKLVLIEHELLSENEFGELPNESSTYNGDYSKYKTERVKKILHKK